MTRTRYMPLLIVVALAALPHVMQGDGRSLVDLELRLSSNPDSLEAANAYRRAVIESGEYDQALRFFAKLVETHPGAANAHLNYGFAYVDKIPAAGSITQVILANSALSEFTRSIELRRSWIAYYTRGASYLFWPKIFGRAPMGIADLEEALRIQQGEERRGCHVRTFVTLGDGYYKTDAPDRARATWEQGLRAFPGNAPLQERLNADPARLAAIVDRAFDPNRRVDTDLSELWSAK